MPTETSAPRRKLSAIVMVDVAGFSRMWLLLAGIIVITVGLTRLRLSAAQRRASGT